MPTQPRGPVALLGCPRSPSRPLSTGWPGHTCHGAGLAARPIADVPPCPLPAAQRPASLDFPCPRSPTAGAGSVSVLLHRELPQIPVPEPPAASPAPDQTYSNLLFPPPRKPAPDTVYECLAVGGEDARVPPVPAGTQVSPPRAGHGAADYACVRKAKRSVPAEVQDGAVARPPTAPRCQDIPGDAPHAKVRLLGGGGLSAGAHGVSCLPVMPV